MLDFTYLTAYIKDQPYSTYMALSYTLGTILFICVIDIALVMYQVKMKGFSQGFPLTFIRNASEIFGSVLYIPSLDLFLSVFQCKNEGGATIHRYYTG